MDGRDGTTTLPDGRVVPLWEGGDPGGTPVLFHAGTPSGRLQAALFHEAAVGAGVRLVSFNRPGYGRAPLRRPGLASVGADARALRESLGLQRWAVTGISGGGPYALATVLADPEGVTRTAVVAGIGPWTVIDPTDDGDPERALLARAAAGDRESAWQGYEELARRSFDGLLRHGDAELVAAYFDGAPADDLGWLDARARERWAADARDALASYRGYVRDNLSWGGRWDIDPRDLRGPVLLRYGEADLLVPLSHGHWHAEQIPRAELEIVPGAGHGMTCFGAPGELLGWLSS